MRELCYQVSSLFLYFSSLWQRIKRKHWMHWRSYFVCICVTSVKVGIYKKKNSISYGFSLSSHVKSSLFVLSNILFTVSAGFIGSQQQRLRSRAFEETRKKKEAKTPPKLWAHKKWKLLERKFEKIFSPLCWEYRITSDVSMMEQDMVYNANVSTSL